MNADAVSAERRALRFKIIAFYAKWEPGKPTADVNDLCEWALQNGVAPFNAKLRNKYGADLTSVTATSVLDLPLESQLKVFYSEFDPRKPQKEIDEVVAWIKSRPSGLAEINVRLDKKYGENLWTMALGGRLHMRSLLFAYFSKVDPLAASQDNITTTIDLAAQHGATTMLQSLVDKYGVALKLSVSEIEGREHEIQIDRAAVLLDPGNGPRPAVMSLMRGQVQPVNAGGAAAMRPLSVALSQLQVQSGGAAPGAPPAGAGAGAGGDNNRASIKTTPLLTVSEDAEMRGLIEIFYAKHNPEKIGDIDPMMKYVRTNGPEALNVKLRAKYGEDLESLKQEYGMITAALREYYDKVDPSKTNIEDIATWAIVHGVYPLSERLAKRYGRGLFDSPEPDLEPDALRARIKQFYSVHDAANPKSDSDLDTIVNWVLASSVKQLNAKLKEKYGKCLDDLPPLDLGNGRVVGLPKETKAGVLQKQLSAKQGAPSGAAAAAAAADVPPPPSSTPPPAPSTSPSAEPLGGGGMARSNSNATPPRAVPSQLRTTPPGSRRTSSAAGRERTDSFASVAMEDSADKMEEQMDAMREIRDITSGRFDGLAAQVRAFYRVNDPDKLNNKEAMDLVLKWTFKHGVPALNEKFKRHYNRTLDSIKVTEEDVEADEADDTVGGDPNW